MPITRRLLFILCLASTMLLASCEGNDTTTGAGGEPTAGSRAPGDRPTVVVTTNILGDVVENLVGSELDVVTVMPVGADPHDFQASAQEANQVRQADALIVNGAGFEESLVDLIEAAAGDGVATYEAITGVDTIAFGAGAHNDDAGEEEGVQGDGAHRGSDPHFFTDPARMAVAARGIVEFLTETVEGVDAAALEASAADYLAALAELDADLQATLAGIAPERRVMVTNHEVFGYLADRYGFEVVGAVIPGGTTTDGASAGQLAELAQTIADEGVPAIFADTSSSSGLASTLAGEVGDIEVIELFSESLGDEGSEGATYLEMMQTNAERIAAALA